MQSVDFGFHRAVSRIWKKNYRRAGQWLLHSPFHPLYLRFFPPGRRSVDHYYSTWVAAEERALPPWNVHREIAGVWMYRPVISVVMATYQPRRDWFEQAVRSVIDQSYPHWQLCIAVDGGSTEWLNDFLRRKAEADQRITFEILSDRLGIGGALNRASRQAVGEYLAFVDHDDLLSPYALHYVVEAMQGGRADLLYTDEDRIDAQGRRVRPHFKPGWSPELLTSCMYCAHLLVISRRAFTDVGGFRPRFDGSQDYDLALRVTEGDVSVKHIPRVLYHWRLHSGSTSENPSSKPYAHEAGRRALEEALIRRWGPESMVEDGTSFYMYRARRELTQIANAATIIVCSRNRRLLKRCLASVGATASDTKIELIVVHHREGASSDGVASVAQSFGCKVIPYAKPFNFSEMNNLAASEAVHSVVLFLNDDVIALRADWLLRMIEHLQRKEIGVVGPKLIYRGGAIQHAGIVLGLGDGVGHPGRFQLRSDLWPWLDMTRDVSAVTGACLGIRRQLFQELGGFDPGFPFNYNDVDLCLRARAAGYRIVLEPAAVLRHDENQTRTGGTTLRERERFLSRWPQAFEKGDLFYSPNLAGVEETKLRLDS